MFSDMRFCFYSFCVLIGFLAFLQQTEGNVDVGTTRVTTGKAYFFYQHPTYPRDCKEVLDQCSVKNSSGVYVIKPDGFSHPFEVYCDNSVDSWGWTVFMRRLDGSLLFTRNWIDYKEGFGFLSSEFFLGNKKLAFLTNQQRYQLRMDITISNGSTGFTKYSYFRISDEWGNFSLASLGEAEPTSGVIPEFCPINMIYANCSCERTCEAPISCQNNCQEVERCTCPDGFYLKGSDCVTPEECPCYYTTAKTVIPMGEYRVNDQCSTQCSCGESGLTCSSYSCHRKARCIRSSEGGRCTCNNGFIGDGRDRCTPLCPTNMIYTNCSCERTCEAPTACQNNCQEESRCVCPNGFFLRGSDCVPLEECPCYSSTAGKVILVGESYINSQCSQRCSCSSSGLSCTNYECDQNARCTGTTDGGRCSCKAGFVGNGENCDCSNTGYLVDGSRCRRPRDCDEVPSTRGYSGSGLYYILPSNWREFQVYCNISEGRWTVLQRRIPDSTRDFYLSWSSYKSGFGELDEDFWLGNDKIHHLTSQRNYQLRIDMIDSGNRHYRAVYDGFRIGNEGTKYRMTVLGRYSGNAGYDAMRHHYNQPFSTSGADNDGGDGVYCRSYYYDHNRCFGAAFYPDNCAYVHYGAWWYKHRGEGSSNPCDHYTYTYPRCCEHSNCRNCRTISYSCAYSNLNGKRNGDKGETIFWHGLSGNDCGIKYTEMKVRPL